MVSQAQATTVRLQTFSMPDVGEGLTEADVLDWRVAVGDTLAVNQVIVEIETAKAAVELPSPFAGRVYALLVQPGETVAVGTPIISIDTDPGAGGPGGPGTTPRRVNGHGAGAKIGEVTADGRVATLVGYTSAAAATSAGRATPRRRPPPRRMRQSSPRARPMSETPPAPAQRPARNSLAATVARTPCRCRGTPATHRWRRRRSASWRRTSGSTCEPYPHPAGRRDQPGGCGKRQPQQPISSRRRGLLATKRQPASFASR